jgi:hypothetical protein
MNEKIIISKSSSFRAVLFIIFTMLIPIISMIIYFYKGYSIFDYPYILKNNYNFMIRDLTGWMGVILCVIYGVIPARLSLKFKNNAIYIDNVDLFCYGKFIGSLRKIEKSIIINKIFKKNLGVVIDGKIKDCGSVIFCAQPPENICKLINRQCDMAKS